MATRTQARESVVGLLYAYELGNSDILNFSDGIFEDKKIRNRQKEFALELFNGTIANLEQIDNEISLHLNNRGIDDIAIVDKSILRLSIYEMQWTSIDKAVSINEAIELAKKLSNDNSPKFINGMLDNIKRD